MSAANAQRAFAPQFDRAVQQRRAMIAKIQIAKKQLQIMEDDYRQALFERTGKVSLTECSDAQLVTMVDWVKSKGFRPTPAKAAATHPMARKARALWISLYQLGVVHNSSEKALETFAKRQLKCERLSWARQSDGNLLIEALKSMGARAGWLMHNPSTQKPLDPIGLQSSLCQAILRKLKEAGVAPADWDLHDAMWRLCGIENGRQAPWSAEDYATLANALGEKLRRHGPARGEEQ